MHDRRHDRLHDRLHDRPDGKADVLPTRMRSARLLQPGTGLAVTDAAVPALAPKEVLVRTTVATVCAITELNVMAGLHPPHDSAVLGMLPHDMRVILNHAEDPFRHHYPTRRYADAVWPAPMGHEAAGVVEVPPAAFEASDLAFPHVPIKAGDSVATFKVPGAYSEFTALPVHNVVKLPPFLSHDEGSLFEPLIINYNCLRRCFAVKDDIRTVLILGQGCQGLISTQLVRAHGAALVIVSDPLAHKRRLALDLGADVALDPHDVNVAHEVEWLTNGRGVDLVVECVGAAETIALFPYTVRRGGVVAQIGAPVMPLCFDYGYVHFKHFMIVPSDYVQSLTQIAGQVSDVLELLRKGAVRLRPLITHRFELDDIAEAFNALRCEREAVIKIAIDISRP